MGFSDLSTEVRFNIPKQSSDRDRYLVNNVNFKLFRGFALKNSSLILMLAVGCIPSMVLGHARLRVAEADGSIPRLITRNALDRNKGGTADAVPCGLQSTVRSTNPVVLMVGEEITVNYEETIGHQGTFQLRFTEDGVTYTDLVTPVADTDTALAGAANQYNFTFTVPDAPCTNCMIQFVQDMNGNNHYKSCVDVVITPAANPPPVQPTGFSATK